jgi:hypothetical protein
MSYPAETPNSQARFQRCLTFSKAFENGHQVTKFYIDGV